MGRSKCNFIRSRFSKKKKLDEKISTQNRNLQQNFAQLVRGYPTILLFDVAASDGKLALNPIAKSGYVSGGPKPFIESLNQEKLKNEKPIECLIYCFTFFCDFLQ